jgi:hypothetical protein
MRRIRCALTAVVAGLVLGVVPGADAAQRFAAPDGAGSACSEAQPCALTTAAGAAQPGDEVLVAPGAYAVGSALGVSAGVDVHGPVGGPAPVLTLGAQLTVAGRLADVAVRSAVFGPLALSGLGERLDVRNTAAQPAVLVGRGAVLRDSVVVTAGGSGAIAWFSFDGRFDLRNVTALNTGSGGYGLYMNGIAGPPGSESIGVVRNSVLVGTAKDVAKVGPVNQTLRIARSAFATADGTITDDGGNTAAPASFFASPVDLHQRPESPTIDAGAVDGTTGALDLDGRPRVTGPAIDMGAYEFPGTPGPPPPPPAGNLLVNPGADAAAGANDAVSDVAIPGWTTTPAFTAVRYGAPSGFPDTVEGTRIAGGANFFAGGPANASSSARQTVDVSARAGEIDAGSATLRLAGDLGGWTANYDAVTVTATLRSATGATLGALAIGPVTAIERGGQTVFLRRERSLPLPAGTRSIDVVISAANAGPASSYNDGYADNLSLTLTVPAAAAPAPPAPAPEPDRLAPRLGRPTLAPASARPGASTTLRVSLSEAASLQITIQRAAGGVLRRGRCVAPRRGLRGRRCTRWVTVRRLAVAGRTGPNAVRLALRAGGRPLRTGRYRVQLTARDAAGNRSAPVSLTLRIRR